MKTDLRRYAPLGLVLSLLALLTAGGLYVVQRQWNLPLQISLGLFVIGLALFAFLDPDRMRQLLTGRQARYGSNALILSLAFIGIIVVINYLVYNNNQQWDLTEDKQFTLAPETKETLTKLPEPVTARAFFSAASSPEMARSLLEQYELQSDGKFKFEFIDPEKNPVAAQEANVTQDGQIVLKMGDRQQPVSGVSEQDLTSGLVRLINPNAATVYFLTGHGEYSPDDTGDQSYAQVKRTLESKNYTVKTLNLLSENQVPGDAKVIVVAGPRKPISEAEVTLLTGFLDQGGSLVVMEEPLPVTDFGEAPDPLADALAKNWGIVLGKDLVFDMTSQSPSLAIAAAYGDHVIVNQLNRRQMTSIFPTARSVTLQNPPEGVSPQTLVSTSQQSWAETNFEGLANQQVQFDQGQDAPGPVSIAVVAENFTQNSRLVVFGDADFVSNAAYGQYGNGDLFTNAVDWAAGQENIIDLTPKNNTQRMMLPPQSVSMNLILLGSVFVLPGIVLVAGIMAFLQRRKRG